MRLPDFLLARIVQDERDARDHAHYFPDDTHLHAWGPDRVLAECQAKRRIIEQYEQVATSSGNDAMSWLEPTLRHLAGVYADHPDYAPQWRP